MSPIVALVVVAGVWAAFTVWSIRTFWRTSDDERQARIYAFTKFTSLFGTLGMAIFLPFELPIPTGSYFLNALYVAFVSLPISLSVMYFCSRLFFAIVDPVRK